MYSIARKRVHLYTCIQYENRKVASSAPKGCVSNSRLFYVFCFRIPNVPVGNHLVCVAINSNQLSLTLTGDLLARAAVQLQPVCYTLYSILLDCAIPIL